MIYLLTGEDLITKDKKINLFKKELLKDKTAEAFDYESFDAMGLDARCLKESLLRLPQIAQKRLVAIKRIENLSLDTKNFLLSYLRKPYNHIHLILDVEKINKNDTFINSLSRFCRILNFAKERALNVFDLTELVSKRKLVGALRLLSQILQKGEKPIKILGAFIWQWKRLQNNLSQEDFKRGLYVLQETDLNIKRNKLKPEFALELLVVKLCSRLS